LSPFLFFSTFQICFFACGCELHVDPGHLTIFLSPDLVSTCWFWKVENNESAHEKGWFDYRAPIWVCYF
jgi:hypothetical protein